MNQLNSKPITFLLADDHGLIRQGLVFVLDELETDVEIFHASSMQSALESAVNNPIDILIIDAHFPDGHSLNIIPEIKKLKPEMKILVFSGIDENVHALKYINAGANGFLSKLSEEDEVKIALEEMIENGEYITSTVQKLLISSMRNPQLLNPLRSLTEREIEIAKMYANGLGNLEIANLLNVKQNTISTVKKRIFDKLMIDNIVELIEKIKEHQ